MIVGGRERERERWISHTRTDEVRLNKLVGEAAVATVGEVPLAGQHREVIVPFGEVAVVDEGVAEDVEAVPVVGVMVMVLVPSAVLVAVVIVVVPLSRRVVPDCPRLHGTNCTRSINKEEEKISI